MWQNLVGNRKEINVKIFKEILDSVTWPEVHDKILEFLIIDNDDSAGYEQVFNELFRLTPASNNDDCTIVINKVHDSFDDRYYYSVSGLVDDVEYAIEYCPWEEWLSYYISEELLDKMSAPGVVAHCLYEMTWGGFTQEEIQKQVNEILEAGKDGDRGIPFDELKKEWSNDG